MALLSKLRINMIHLVVDCIDYRDRERERETDRIPTARTSNGQGGQGRASLFGGEGVRTLGFGCMDIYVCVYVICCYVCALA